MAQLSLHFQYNHAEKENNQNLVKNGEAYIDMVTQKPSNYFGNRNPKK